MRNMIPRRNDINFPAGILQPPLFDPNSDAAPNYGDTGGTIGHELTHGFDDEGRQFDAQGNLRDWWTTADGKEFEKRAGCISAQYSKYVIIDDIKINGRLTLGEDVADLGGVLLAYKAWKQATEGQAGTDRWAHAGTEVFRRLRAKLVWQHSRRSRTIARDWDPHSPDKYRANGVVTNMREFQEAFHCKTGAPMAPESRCRVW